jgi:hypothetical protein
MMSGVMSTMEALAAIPEPLGVTLWRVPPYWKAEGLTVEVGFVAGTAGPAGRGARRSGLHPVPLDAAHDLSWRGPEVWVWPESGGNMGVLTWTVIALGFIEQEAREAFRAVCAAIDG